MADVSIVDGVGLSADLKIRDDSPLAKAGLRQLLTTTKDLYDDLDKPLDQVAVQSVALGGSFQSPQLLCQDLQNLSACAGVNCELNIVRSADQLLFPDDGFSPVVAIAPDQAWLGVEFDLIGSAKGGAAADGVGIAFAGSAKFTCTTYTLFAAAASPLPRLRDACVTAFENFSLTSNAAAVRSQPAQSIHVHELCGSVTVAVTLEQPFTLNPLAAANLPFNESASLQPDVTVQLCSSLGLAGDFLVRSWKVSDAVVRLGVYKKHGSTLSATLTAGAGVGGDIGSDDILGAVLNAALPGVNVAAAGITGDHAKALNGVIRDALCRSLSAQMNITCSAAQTDEAAVLYEIQLSGGDGAATDRAIGLALHGDWTALESLPNAHRMRNIAVATAEKKRALSVNLFGFYNATSIGDYLKSCTVLADESGQVAMIDKVDASRISASVAPYAADTNKLRQALMEDFLCTATYAVVAGKMHLNLRVLQSYFDYKRAMSQEEMQENVLLGYALGVIPQGALDGVLQGHASFQHACVSAVVHYDMAALLDVFYKDPATRTQRSSQEIEQAGRQAMCLLLDASDATDAVRLSVLRNEAAWQQMDETGNTAAFGTLPTLSHLGATQLATVCADWVSIVWWAEALAKIAPALSRATTALEAAPASDPTHDPDFMKARQNLSNVLGAVTRNTDAAFVHGWGEAVMFALSGRQGAAQMDLAWNSMNRHFGAAAGS